jgi:hypothetical protein
MRMKARLLAAAALALPALAHAAADEYVNTPNVEYGEREIDTKYGTRYFDDAHERESAASFGFGYGATQWWFTEAYLKYHKEPGDKTRYDAFEWENKFQLTEPNKYPIDVGALVELEIPRDRDEGYEVKLGPLLQWDTGPLRWNTNVFLQRSFSTRGDEDPVTEMKYQAQVTYHIRDTNFDVGAQAFGDLGKWNDWAPKDEQSHRIGPAVFGKVKLEGRQAIVWNAAWLFGASKAAADNAFRLQAEYEF